MRKILIFVLVISIVLSGCSFGKHHFVITLDNGTVITTHDMCLSNDRVVKCYQSTSDLEPTSIYYNVQSIEKVYDNK